MAMDYFPCYTSYGRILSKLSDQELGRLFRALLAYTADGTPADLPGKEAVAYDFIVDDIDRARENYDAKCASRRENGKKGGRPKNQTVSDENLKNQMVLEKTEKSKRESKSESKRESKREYNSPSDEGENACARVGPTLEEITAYCRERKSRVNPARFYAYFEERGWAGVTDWRARIRSWEANGIDKPDLHDSPASYDIARAEQKAKTVVPALEKRRKT